MGDQRSTIKNPDQESKTNKVAINQRISEIIQNPEIMQKLATLASEIFVLLGLITDEGESNMGKGASNELKKDPKPDKSDEVVPCTIEQVLDTILPEDITKFNGVIVSSDRVCSKLPELTTSAPTDNNQKIRASLENGLSSGKRVVTDINGVLYTIDKKENGSYVITKKVNYNTSQRSEEDEKVENDVFHPYMFGTELELSMAGSVYTIYEILDELSRIGIDIGGLLGFEALEKTVEAAWPPSRPDADFPDLIVWHEEVFKKVIEILSLISGTKITLTATSILPQQDITQVPYVDMVAALTYLIRNGELNTDNLGEAYVLIQNVLKDSTSVKEARNAMRDFNVAGRHDTVGLDPRTTYDKAATIAQLAFHSPIALYNRHFEIDDVLRLLKKYGYDRMNINSALGTSHLNWKYRPSSDTPTEEELMLYALGLLPSHRFGLLGIRGNNDLILNWHGPTRIKPVEDGDGSSRFLLETMDHRPSRNAIEHLAGAAHSTMLTKVMEYIVTKSLVGKNPEEIVSIFMQEFQIKDENALNIMFGIDCQDDTIHRLVLDAMYNQRDTIKLDNQVYNLTELRRNRDLAMLKTARQQQDLLGFKDSTFDLLRAYIAWTTDEDAGALNTNERVFYDQLISNVAWGES